MKPDFVSGALHRRFATSETFDQAVHLAFHDTLKEFEREMDADKPETTKDYVARVEQVSKIWSEGAITFNVTLLNLSSREVVNPDCFKPLLRNQHPQLYFQLLMQGMEPMEDECSMILEMRQRYHARRKHKGTTNG